MANSPEPMTGGDLVAPDFDGAAALRCLTADKQREIGLALRDSTCLSGVDNRLICEVLYVTGTSPWSAVGDVNVGSILNTLRVIAIANEGLELISTTGTRRAGHEFYVHARAHANCRRCRGKIAAAIQGTKPDEHMTYFCPTCQPGEHPPVLAYAARRPASKDSR
jgi:endonuclease-8